MVKVLTASPSWNQDVIGSELTAKTPKRLAMKIVKTTGTSPLKKRTISIPIFA